MALATRTDRGPTPVRAFWDSTLGKKTVMAVSGLVMLAYLVLHMFGNLKIFFGPGTFNGYAHWLRTVGEPFLHYGWALWAVRVLLVASVVAHGVCAYQLSRRDIRARPVGYVHRRARAGYATRTMRWGGVILALFVVWHLLDLTTLTVNRGVILALFVVWHLLDLTTLTVNRRAEPGHPYQNVVATFHTWYGDAVYIVAMLALGLHIRHGFWSAAQSLGAGSARRDRLLRLTADALALAITAGFVAVPVGVMTGTVH